MRIQIDLPTDATTVSEETNGCMAISAINREAQSERAVLQFPQSLSSLHSAASPHSREPLLSDYKKKNPSSVKRN